jgi:hypothetical protein
MDQLAAVLMADMHASRRTVLTAVCVCGVPADDPDSSLLEVIR